MCLPPVPVAVSVLGGGGGPLGAVGAKAGVSKKVFSHPAMVVETYARFGI